MLLLAVVYNLIAISTIIPPGTLSISPRTIYNSEEMAVPALNWTLVEAYSSADFFSNGIEGDNLTALSTLVSNLEISRIVSLTVLQHRIPTLPTFALNSSYELDVVGPAIQCANQFSSEGPRKWAPYCPADNSTVVCGQVQTDWTGYMAWIPNTAILSGYYSPLIPDDNTIMPRIDNSSLTGFNFTGMVDCDSLVQDVSSADARQFINPDFQLDITMATKILPSEASSVTPFSWTWTRCNLANATYRVAFNFSDTAQTVTVLDRTIVDLEKTVYTFNNSEEAMELTGGVIYNNASFNYINLMSSFGQMISGVVDVYGKVTSSPKIFQSSNFTSTDELQANLANFPYSQFTFPASKSSSGALAPFLEEVFTNITVAMFTYGDALTTASTNVTTWGPVQVYTYSWRHLALSYGIGIAITLLAVAHGCFICVVINGASYSIAFSTFMRITPWLDIDDLLATDELKPGASPVPPEIAAAKLRLGAPREGNFNGTANKPPADVNVDVTEASSMLSAPPSIDPPPESHT